MHPHLQWMRTMHPPPLDGVVELDCGQRVDRSIDCKIIEETLSLYPLREAALAFIGELKSCSPEPQRFTRTFEFRTEP